MKRHIFFGSVVATIILLWGASWYFIPKLYNAQSLEAGTFGDMFGAVNALFSGLAFAGLIYTITVQRQELALQREAITMQTEELRMQREETARSADQLEGQKLLQNLQMAMNIVNELLSAKNARKEDISKIKVSKYDKAFSLNGLLDLFLRDSDIISENADYLKGYLDTFFFILNFIDNYDLQNDQKEILSSMVNINTSDFEIYLIFLAVSQNEKRNNILKAHGFNERYERLMEDNNKSPH